MKMLLPQAGMLSVVLHGMALLTVPGIMLGAPRRTAETPVAVTFVGAGACLSAAEVAAALDGACQLATVDAVMAPAGISAAAEQAGVAAPPVAAASAAEPEPMPAAPAHELVPHDNALTGATVSPPLLPAVPAPVRPVPAAPVLASSAATPAPATVPSFVTPLAAAFSGPAQSHATPAASGVSGAAVPAGITGAGPAIAAGAVPSFGRGAAVASVAGLGGGTVPGVAAGQGNGTAAGAGGTTQGTPITVAGDGTVLLTNMRYRLTPPPVYPPVARQRGYQGVTRIRVTVDEAGSVAALVLVQSSGYVMLDRAALTAVQSWQFVPLLVDGVARRAVGIVPVRFALQ